jgi:DNA-binding MltR family transcriptional regulator
MANNPQSNHRFGKDELLRRLTGLIKVRPNANDIEEHVARLQAESDRGVMILAATMLDDALLTALGRTMPNASRSLRDQIFSNDGPLSAFSKRITFAEALGLISPVVARQTNVIRKIRNVAAHAHAAVDFSLDEVKQALATMFEDNEKEMISRPGLRPRSGTFISRSAGILPII